MERFGGNLTRDGINYLLSWENGGREVSEWAINTYVDEGFYQLWQYPFTLYDGISYDVTRQGEDILVIDASRGDTGFSRTEMLFHFYPNERLSGIEKSIVFTDAGQPRTRK